MKWEDFGIGAVQWFWTGDCTWCLSSDLKTGMGIEWFLVMLDAFVSPTVIVAGRG